MLGRHHVAITLATLFPLIIPIVFLSKETLLLYSIAFLIAAIIGSLTPDADCGGKSKLYYDFWIISQLMYPIMKLTVWVFKLSKVKSKISAKFQGAQDVNYEHRGIMHSPIGILISSFLLTLILSIFMAFIGSLNFIFIFVIFLGLIIGQILHLLEDSCTVSGINWKFPFGIKEIKGKVYTFGKIPGKIDIRPSIFVYSLGGLSAILFILFALNLINFSLWILYPLITISVIIAWSILFGIAKSNSYHWYRDEEKVKEWKKKRRRAERNIIKFSLEKERPQKKRYNSYDPFESIFYPAPKKRRKKKKRNNY